MFFFFQAEDGIRDAQESRGLGDVYKRQYENVIPYNSYFDFKNDTAHTESTPPLNTITAFFIFHPLIILCVLHLYLVYKLLFDIQYLLF